MLFELLNLSVSFQNYINKILVEKLNIFVIVYLNDIFIYTEDLSQSRMVGVRCFEEARLFCQL